MESFPAGPYYVYHILAGFQQRVKLPPALKTLLRRNDSLELSGTQLEPVILDALLQAVSQGKVRGIYLSPFHPKTMDGSTVRPSLIDQWYQTCYTHGCGAMVYNRDCSAAYFRCLDQSILNRPVRLQSNTESLLHPPVIFENHQDMADAVRSMILTGSPDGTCGRPPAVSETRRGVDPNLLFWIENIYGFVPESFDGLKKVNGLTANFYVAGYPRFPDWLAPEPGNWSLLGDLPDLRTLFMPEVKLDNWDFLTQCTHLQRLGIAKTNLSDPDVLKNLAEVTYLELPAAEFGDFSFLELLPELEILDLSRTDFQDCSVLTRLPNLKRVLLPAERQLLHLECLEPLPVQVKTNPRRVRGKNVTPFELIPPRPAEPLDLKPPYKVLHIESDTGSFEGAEITEKCVRNLMEKARAGRIEMIYASLEPWGEDEYLGIDMADGWASIIFSDSEANCDYCICNPDHIGDYEDAPPEIGGQSPVPKQHAVQNLSLAADCLGYFIKTGSFYPGAYWAKYYK